MEFWELSGLRVPLQRSRWPLLCFIHGQYEGMDEKQPVCCSFPLSLSGDKEKAGFLKSGSEMLILLPLAVGYGTDDEWNVLLIKMYICFHKVLFRDVLLWQMSVEKTNGICCFNLRLQIWFQKQFQRGLCIGRSILVEGGRHSSDADSEGWWWLLGSLWAGLVWPRWQCVPAAIAAVIWVIADHCEWILGVSE